MRRQNILQGNRLAAIAATLHPLVEYDKLYKPQRLLRGGPGQDGNAGEGFPHFPKGTPVAFTSVQENLGNERHEVTLDMPDARTLQGCLLVPTKPRGPAGFGSLLAERLRSDMIAKAKDGSLTMPAGVQFTIALPADATYTHWQTTEDNNLLECIERCPGIVSFWFDISLYVDGAFYSENFFNTLVNPGESGNLGLRWTCR